MKISLHCFWELLIFTIKPKIEIMKNLSFYSILLFAAAVSVFNSCKKDDVIAPEIYLLGNSGQSLGNTDQDTIVLLFTKYTDPGVLVEDNVSKVEDIVVINNIEDALDITSDGYLRRAEDVIITYTATDEALNDSEIHRNVSIKNISEPFAGVYSTGRTSMFVDSETTYNSTVSVDTRIPGRINFPKVYSHIDTDESVYFKLAADLYNPGLSTEFSSLIGYMGTTTDKEDPFFKDMTYVEGIDTVLSFNLLMISAQSFTDALGNQYTISGVSNPADANLPYSRIEYLSGTKTIKRIILELNVTKDGVYTDRVTEIYVPQ